MSEQLPAVSSVSLKAPVTRDENGKVVAPRFILPTVQAARSIYETCRGDHIERTITYAEIEGLIAGNAPYAQEDLEANNLAFITNTNTLDARATYKRHVLAFQNLLYDTENLVKITINHSDPAVLPMQDTLSQHFTWMLRKSSSFQTQMSMLVAQLSKFGLSPAMWPNEKDWQFRTIDLSKFYVRNQASSDIGQLTFCAVETTMTAQELFDVYNQFCDTEETKTPWNCDVLGTLLVNRANSYDTSSNVVDALDLQRRVQNSDLTYYQAFTDDIKIISVLVREYDKTITHLMFPKDLATTKFIFVARGQYKSFEEAMVVFTADPGEMTLHSNKGVGHSIYSLATAIMMNDCSIFDMARWAASIIINSPSTGNKDIEQIRWYPGAPINIGTAQLQQNNIGTNINQLIQASQFLGNKMDKNAANAGEDPTYNDKDKGSVSAPQVMIQAFRETGLPKNMIQHFYSIADKLYENVFVKALHSERTCPNYDLVKEFKRRCVRDGVPEMVFELKELDDQGMPQILSIKAARVAGDGSTAGRIMGMNFLKETGITETFGPREAKEYKREGIMIAFGPDYVNAFTQDTNQADTSTDGASFATLENNSMQAGMGVTFSKQQDHLSHATVHISLGDHIMSLVQTGQMDIVKAATQLALLMPHLTQHIQVLEQSPFSKQDFEKIKPAYDAVQKFADLNAKNAKAQQDADQKKQALDQQKTQNVMDDSQRKDFVAKGDENRKNVQAAGKEKRAQEQSDNKAALMEKTAQDKASTDQLRVTLEHSVNKKQQQLDQSENTVDNFESTEAEDGQALNAPPPLAPGVPPTIPQT